MLKMAYFHAYWALFCIKVALVTDITIISVAIGRAGIAHSKTPNRHKSGLEVGLEKNGVVCSECQGDYVGNC